MFAVLQQISMSPDICHSYSKRMVRFIALNNSEVILDYLN